MATLPPASASALAEEAPVVAYPAGSMIFRHDDVPKPSLILSGIVAAFVESADGRRAGVGTARVGEAIAVAHLFNSRVPINLQAVTDVTLAHFPPGLLRRLAAQDIHVSAAVAQHLAERLGQYYGEVRSYVFETARERLASQLRERATTSPDGRLVVKVTHQEMADAIGCVREHVARLLAELRAEGVVTTRRESIIIHDLDALPEANAPSGPRPS